MAILKYSQHAWKGETSLKLLYVWIEEFRNIKQQGFIVDFILVKFLMPINISALI